MAPMTALSHLTIAAPNKALLDAALQFYSRLGFKTISAETDDVWLHLFPPAANKDGCGFTLRLIVDEPSSFDQDAFVKDMKKKLDGLDGHAGHNTWGCFVVQDVEVHPVHNTIPHSGCRTSYAFLTSTRPFKLNLTASSIPTGQKI